MIRGGSVPAAAVTLPEENPTAIVSKTSQAWRTRSIFRGFPFYERSRKRSMTGKFHYLGWQGKQKVVPSHNIFTATFFRIVTIVWWLQRFLSVRKNLFRVNCKPRSTVKVRWVFNKTQRNSEAVHIDVCMNSSKLLFKSIHFSLPPARWFACKLVLKPLQQQMLSDREKVHSNDVKLFI